VKATLGRRLTAELLGTGFLVATVIGSGIMGERLAGGNVAIALLANTIATGAALVALILAFGPISGAHFNPVVTLSDAFVGGIRWRETPGYVSAQVLGAMGGAVVAHWMFGLPTVFLSQHARSGVAQLFSELIATFGLMCVIGGCARRRPGRGGVRGGCVHYGGVLVHGIDFVCESSSDPWPGAERHVRGDTGAGCAGICGGADRGRAGGDDSISMAGAWRALSY
jgi:glycerol uptake facilitator-like aquaporin